MPTALKFQIYNQVTRFLAAVRYIVHIYNIPTMQNTSGTPKNTVKILYPIIDLGLVNDH